jgi:hypothetical protein
LYQTSRAPVLDLGLTRWNTSGFNLTLQGLAGSNFVIESSTDLVNWLPLAEFTVTNSPMSFSDPTITNASFRFYRAMMK